MFSDNARRVPPIVQGSKGALLIKLKLLSAPYGPFDLTNCSALTCCFLNLDGTELTLGLGTGITILQNPSFPTLVGQIQVSLTAAQTILLAPVEDATLELAITISSGDPIITQIRNAYSIAGAIC